MSSFPDCGHEKSWTVHFPAVFRVNHTWNPRWGQCSRYRHTCEWSIRCLSRCTYIKKNKWFPVGQNRTLGKCEIRWNILFHLISPLFPMWQKTVSKSRVSSWHRICSVVGIWSPRSIVCRRIGTHFHVSGLISPNFTLFHHRYLALLKKKFPDGTDFFFATGINPSPGRIPNSKS